MIFLLMSGDHIARAFNIRSSKRHQRFSKPDFRGSFSQETASDLAEAGSLISYQYYSMSLNRSGSWRMDHEAHRDLEIVNGVLRQYNGNDENVVIPSNVKHIQEMDFMGSKCIEDSTFEGCAS